MFGVLGPGSPGVVVKLPRKEGEASWARICCLLKQDLNERYVIVPRILLQD